MPTKLQSAIKSLVDKYGIVETSEKIGVTTVSLQAFLHNSEVYAKTLAKMQKAAGVEVTAVSAKEKAKAAAVEKRTARKEAKQAKEAAKEKAKAKKIAKPKRAKAKAKKVKAKSKVKIKVRSRKKMKVKKKKSRAPKPPSNGVSGPSLPVAADEDDEELVATAHAAQEEG